MNSKFSYGDAVIIRKNAPCSSGEFGSVCSLNQVTSEEQAQKFKCKVGEWVYTIEFENGSDIQVAEIYLDGYQKVHKQSKRCRALKFFATN